MHDPAGWAGTVVCMSGWLAAGLGSLPLATYRHGHDGRVRSRSAEPGAGRGGRLRCSGKTTLAREVAARLDARHIERGALGDDEALGFAALVAAAVEAAGRRWVFDGARQR